MKMSAIPMCLFFFLVSACNMPASSANLKSILNIFDKFNITSFSLEKFTKFLVYVLDNSAIVIIFV